MDPLRTKAIEMSKKNETTTMASPVARALREIRTKHGHTLDALAQKTGVSVTALSRIETGLQQPPRRVLVGYARNYGLPADHFINDDHYRYFSAIVASFAEGVQSLNSQISRNPAKTTLKEIPNDLPDVDHIARAACLLFLTSKSPQARLLWSSKNPFFENRAIQIHLQDALDIFLAQSAQMMHIVRLPEYGHPAINCQIFTLGIRWALRYLHLSASGTSAAYLMSSIDDLRPIKFPTDIWLTDDIGCVIAFSTRQSDIPDGGLFLPNPGYSIAGFMENALKNSKLCIRPYGPGRKDAGEFAEEMVNRSDGPYLAHHGFFTAITRPVTDFYEGTEWFARAKDKYVDPRRVAEKRINRYHRLMENLNSQSSPSIVYRQICSRKQIRDWARKGVRHDTNDGKGPPELNVQSRLARVDHMIELLKNDKFEIAVTTEFDDANNLSWVVQGSYRAALEMPVPLSQCNWVGDKEKQENHARVIIDHRDVADIMSAEFDKLWVDLDPQDKEKRYVFDFLHQIKRDISENSD